MLDRRWKSAVLIQYTISSIQHQRNPLNYQGKLPVTVRERSYRCKDPSLQFPEGILPHRYICQANMGSPPSAVCRGQELRTDNLLLQPLLAQRQSEEVRLPQFRLAGYPWVELVRSDWTAVAAADTLPSGWEDNSPAYGGSVAVPVALQRMRRAGMPRGGRATMKIS